MKTAYEKANEFMREHFPQAGHEHGEALVKLLKEQDRDTRHACAEAVINSPDLDAACTACMNVQAV